MDIKEVTSYTPQLKRTIDRFLELLKGKELTVTEEALSALIDSQNSHLFVALDDNGAYMGMITVGIYEAPTGRKAWIEDVVVDDTYRGKGVGKRLTEFAIVFAEKQQVDLLSLTSNPARIAANNLYPRVGFARKETNVYVMPFKAT